MSEQQSRWGMLSWLWVSAVVIALDLLTKYLVQQHLVLGQSIPQLPVFNLVRLHNYGAAFSFLGDASGWQRWLFTLIAMAVSVVLVMWLKQLKSDQRWLAVGLTLVLGGALGNLYDRVTLGYVVDFIQVYWQHYYFPAFNVADSAITVGAGMLILDAFLNRNEHDESEKL